MSQLRSPQVASLRVEELEQRSLPSSTPAPSVAAIVKDLQVDIRSIQHSVDALKIFTDSVVTSLVNDVKTGQDTTADLKQLDRLMLPLPSSVTQVFWDMRIKAGKAQDIQNDLTVLQRWGVQLETFLKQQVPKVSQDLSQNVDATKDLYLIESGVDYFAMCVDQGVPIFLADLSRHG